MNVNKILQSLFGNKSTRDMKLIQPIVEKIKAEYPNIKALSNDELRAKTKEIQKYVQDYAKEEKAKIAELKAKIEDTPIWLKMPSRSSIGVSSILALSSAILAFSSLA